ncbi:MAG: hypothetical protein Q7S11_00630 [bacterium]|nr:hypothetical protein [bacterium]
MISPELLDYIKDTIRNNQSREVITKNLLQNGWDLEDVSEGFDIIVGPTYLSPTSPLRAKPITHQESKESSKPDLVVKENPEASAEISTVVLPLRSSNTFTLAITFLLVLIVIVSFGGTYILRMKTGDTRIPLAQLEVHPEVSQPIPQIQENDQLSPPDEEQKTIATQVIDCENEECFQEAFTACREAILQIDTGVTTAYYKIVGLAPQGCEMMFKYTVNPNDNWVNKEITCILDNQINFQRSMVNAFKEVVEGSMVICTGPFVGVLKLQGT